MATEQCRPKEEPVVVAINQLTPKCNTEKSEQQTKLLTGGRRKLENQICGEYLYKDGSHVRAFRLPPLLLHEGLYYSAQSPMGDFTLL
jgi:hypothetical protein